MTRDDSPSERRKWPWSKLGIAAAALLVFCGVLEVAARVRAGLVKQPHSAAALEREWRAIASVVLSPTQGFVGDMQDAQGLRTVLHPYVGWDWTGTREALARELVYFEDESSESAFDIVLVGGSVGAALGNQAGKRIVERLTGDARLAGRPVRLLNHARAAFKQPQLAMWIDYLLILGYEPDLVLVVDGFNELALSIDNAKHKGHPLHPAISQWAHLIGGAVTDRETLDAALALRSVQRGTERWLQRALALRLNHSAVTGPLITRALKARRSQYLEARERYVRISIDDADGSYSLSGPPFSRERQHVIDMGVQAWREGSRSIAALCRGRSIRYLHVLQPALHDEGSKPLTADEIAASSLDPAWIAAIRAGYPRLRAAGAELAAEGSAFLDASRLFEQVDMTLYTDACHLSLEGYERLGDAIATAILGLFDEAPAPGSASPRATASDER